MSVACLCMLAATLLFQARYSFLDIVFSQDVFNVVVRQTVN